MIDNPLNFEEKISNIANVNERRIYLFVRIENRNDYRCFDVVKSAVSFVFMVEPFHRDFLRSRDDFEEGIVG